LVFRLKDGLEIETVVLPMANHNTVCISSQAGCRMGCRFCRTGRMGLLRHLSVAEIVAQVYMVRVALGMKVRNVVFMGMGEPLDNFDAVAQAVEVLGDQRGLDIAPRHITISTVGLVDGIKKLAALDLPQLKLAVSLNAPDDAVRNTLMPINGRYPMAVLKQALAQFPLARGNALFVEYVLIRGINDQPHQAHILADFLAGLPVKLNLIACNPAPDMPYAAPESEGVDRFLAELIDRGVFVRLRASKGAGIQAACGQLGDSSFR
ncbi:MAG: 23S rRNA (adenine(2503)-C(2))-methyltransferase RlmN, partial [Desulfosarcinaceae bacterium]